MEKTVDSRSIAFLSFFLRLVPAGLFVIAVFYFIGPFYIKGHLKLFKNEIELLHPEYEVLSYDITKINQLDYIEFLFKVNKVPDDPGASAKKGSKIRLKGQASTICIASIIVFSLILAWPGLALKQRINAALVSIPMLFIHSCLDYPMIFISDIESVYSSNSVVLNNIREMWNHSLNNGGRQFLALLIFLAALTITFPREKAAAQEIVGRNAPCPCGSGKKYKHCCLP